jgi:hypothetical protein
MVLNLSFASIAVRHWWMKTYWSQVKKSITHYVQRCGKR